MSQKYEKLKSLLKELFQLDQPDLDFGLYRIMHAKAGEVTQFLDRDLLPQVQQAFGLYQTADKAEIEKELAKVVVGVQAAGMDPEQSPKVQELRVKLATEAVDLAALENEVYDYLYSFFRRYYSDGDFLAKRVYKPGVYAIPYEGEEVKLHWANRDQYYIKTSEYLRDYAFRLHPDNEDNPRRVHFRLVDATEGEHGNVKPAEGKDRVFILAPGGESGRDFIAEEQGPQGNELCIRFEYRPAQVADWPEESREGKNKPPTQKELIALAVQRILTLRTPLALWEKTGAAGDSVAFWITELGKPHVTADGERADYSRLEAHLRRYTARNTFDYFIHKDLGGFLRRELDFYVKNEVMHLDDIESETAPRVEQYLSKIKVIRRIAGKIIDFLAQLEDFQKKLWLKKKFVVETQYCIRLGCTPEEFYPEIAANDAQREEWVRLYAINEIKGDLTSPGYSVPLTFEFLKAHPTLVVDTRHFESEFFARLLNAIGELDGESDGVLIHSENFQALRLMSPRYANRVKCVYVDPPYNTSASEIIYKNSYKHSSWLALLNDRLVEGRSTMTDDGIIAVAIDDAEVTRLLLLMEDVFGVENHLATTVLRSKPQGRAMASGFSQNHEYAVFFAKTSSAQVGVLPREGDKLQRYGEKDNRGIFAWANFRGTGANSFRKLRPKMFYPICINEKTAELSVPELRWNAQNDTWTVCTRQPPEHSVVYPVDDDGVERVWMFGVERARQEVSRDLEARKAGGRWQIYRKYRPTQAGALPDSWWADAKYSASTKWNSRRFPSGMGSYGPSRGCLSVETERTNSRLSIQGMRCCSALMRSITGNKSA
jgi:adenine-specific DNA-methyltransferase